MFPKIFGILNSSNGPVPLTRLSDAMSDLHPAVASKVQNLDREISKHLEAGRKFGLISGTDRGFKVTVNLDKREDMLFHPRLQLVQEQLEALGPDTPEEPLPGPSDSVSPNVRPSRASTLDQMRPPVQRRVSSSRRRMTSPNMDRAMMRASSRSRGSSRSQPRSRSRTRSRTRSRSRSRSSRFRR